MFNSYSEIFTERASSYGSAMARWPRARDTEFESVAEPLLSLPPGLVCDMPAGGGYLEHFLPDAWDYVAVEPADGFFRDAALSRTVKRISSPVTKVPLATGSVDCIVSLAGLHHEDHLLPIFCEMFRLVKAGGLLVIADVYVGSGPALFLNGFVDRHNPMGHDGKFLDERTAPLLAQAGFDVCADTIVSVPWSFGSVEEAGSFCSDLFGLSGITSREVAQGLAEDVGIEQGKGSVLLRWSLRRIVCRRSSPD